MRRPRSVASNSSFLFVFTYIREWRSSLACIQLSRGMSTLSFTYASSRLVAIALLYNIQRILKHLPAKHQQSSLRIGARWHGKGWTINNSECPKKSWRSYQPLSQQGSRHGNAILWSQRQNYPIRKSLDRSAGNEGPTYLKYIGPNSCWYLNSYMERLCCTSWIFLFTHLSTSITRISEVMKPDYWVNLNISWC